MPRRSVRAKRGCSNLSMSMSYAHAWKLLDATEETFGTPLIVTATGGAKGGGAMLTPQGRAVLERYRDIERRANRATAGALATLKRAAAL
jgi:molybdate transport system regulatory protein